MGAFNVHDMMKADSSGLPTTGAATPVPVTSKLHPLAETVAAIPVRPSISPIFFEAFARMADLAAIIGVAIGVYLMHVKPAEHELGPYLYIVPLLALGAVGLFQPLRLYNLGTLRNLLPQIVRLAGAWLIIITAVLAGLFFLKASDTVSRGWLLGTFAGGFAALLLVRGILALVIQHLTRLGRLERRIAIVGGGEAGAELISALDAQKNTGLRICGVFDDRFDSRSPDLVAGYPKLGNVDDLVEFARRTRLDLVIFTLPISAEQRLLQMLRKLWVLPIDIRLAAHMSKLRFRPRSYSYIGSVPVLDVFDRPIADWDVVTKWLFDKVVGTLALIALSPVMLVTAIAIKLDSKGPVLFRQKRYGFNNELIEVFKFRSMYTDMSDATAAKLVTKDDPRVTRVGRFIRKTSLDELPQLINVVFSGNLSLVGPRPHAVHAKAANELYNDVVDGYFARHKVKPGITGWAQINGWRGETDTQDKIQRRVEHDIYYIENWSLLFDLYILAKTPSSLLTQRENAY